MTLDGDKWAHKSSDDNLANYSSFGSPTQSVKTALKIRLGATYYWDGIAILTVVVVPLG
jgi:hypothetical protein